MTSIETKLRTVLAVFVALSIVIPTASAASEDRPEEQPDVHPLAIHLGYRLEGTGEWRSPNPGYDTQDPNSPSEFGIALRWGDEKQHINGEVFGKTPDDRRVVYQTILIFLDPAENDVIVQQVGWDGALARGRQPLRKKVIGKGDVDVLDMEIIKGADSSMMLRHEDTVLGPDRYRSVVSRRVEDQWVKEREWIWTREPEVGPCVEDCPVLEKKIVIHASPDRVWNAWTTNEGIRSISAESNIELKVGGPYEWFLDLPPDENGLRGGQGSRVLAFVPKRMLTFSWTFPPSVPTLRAAKENTTVVVLFDEIAEGAVEVQLHALGWQAGEDWRTGWEYFDKAWEYVLNALKQELEKPASVNRPY